MKTLRIPRVVLFLVSIMPLAAQAGNVQLQVTNTSATQTVSVSDLIYTDSGGTVISEIDAGDASDDVPFAPGATHIFTLADVDVSKGFILSETIGGSEREFEILNARLLQPRKIAFAQQAFVTGNDQLFVSIDDDLATVEPADQSLVTFAAGVNAGLPGWTVYSTFDLGARALSNPFTGTARIHSSNFEMTIVPEPATLAAALAGGALLALRRRR